MSVEIINKELCKQIKGFERYHISESGRIYRTQPKPGNTKEQKRLEEQSYISENKIHFREHNGKLRQALVSITDNNGRLRNLVVSNLMVVAFIDENFNHKKNSVGYKDENKKNYITQIYI